MEEKIAMKYKYIAIKIQSNIKYIFSHSVRKVSLCARSSKTACAKSSFAHVV